MTRRSIGSSEKTIHAFDIRLSLGLSQRNSEVVETRDRIQKWGPVRKILEKQNRKGGWDRGSSWYHPKYKSSV
ncbi:MAG: hypothetical protein ACUVT7_05815 [Thermoplasmata archaeon]